MYTFYFIFPLQFWFILIKRLSTCPTRAVYMQEACVTDVQIILYAYIIQQQ